MHELRIASRRRGVLALAAAAALTLAACGADGEDPMIDDLGDPGQDQTAVPEQGLPETDDPLGDPQAHIGQQVTATGQVGEVYSATAFEFIGDAGQGSIIVVGDAEATWTNVTQGDLVRVSGTIQEGFDPTTIDGTEEQQEGLTIWEGNAYLEAETVEVQIT